MNWYFVIFYFYVAVSVNNYVSHEMLVNFNTNLCEVLCTGTGTDTTVPVARPGTATDV